MIERVRLFWTATAGFNSRLCAHVTHSEQTHMGVIFDRTDCKSVYMEAMFRKGIVPARSTSKLDDFLFADPGKNRLWIADTDIQGMAAQRMYEAAQDDVGALGYYEWQLVLMWFNERIGRFIRWTMPRSEKLVVCSEWAAKLCYNAGGVDMRDEYRTVFDAVTPGSAFRRVSEYNAKQPTEIKAGEKI